MRGGEGRERGKGELEERSERNGMGERIRDREIKTTRTEERRGRGEMEK